jgi:hypothetical protein
MDLADVPMICGIPFRDWVETSEGVQFEKYVLEQEGTNMFSSIVEIICLSHLLEVNITVHKRVSPSQMSVAFVTESDYSLVSHILIDFDGQHFSPLHPVAESTLGSTTNSLRLAIINDGKLNETTVAGITSLLSAESISIAVVSEGSTKRCCNGRYGRFEWYSPWGRLKGGVAIVSTLPIKPVLSTIFEDYSITMAYTMDIFVIGVYIQPSSNDNSDAVDKVFTRIADYISAYNSVILTGDTNSHPDTVRRRRIHELAGAANLQNIDVILPGSSEKGSVLYVRNLTSSMAEYRNRLRTSGHDRLIIELSFLSLNNQSKPKNAATPDWRQIKRFPAKQALFHENLAQSLNTANSSLPDVIADCIKTAALKTTGPRRPRGRSTLCSAKFEKRVAEIFAKGDSISDAEKVELAASQSKLIKLRGIIERKSLSKGVNNAEILQNLFRVSDKKSKKCSNIQFTDVEISKVWEKIRPNDSLGKENPWKLILDQFKCQLTQHPSLTNEGFTPDDIRRNCLSLKANKASADIPRVMLVELTKSEVFLSKFCESMNFMLVNGWKSDIPSRLTLLDKKTSPETPLDLRPINAMPLIRTVTESLVYERLKPIVDASSISISYEQTGFRPKGCGTIAAIMLTRLVCEYHLYHKIPLYICSFDMEKAFDKSRQEICAAEVSRRCQHNQQHTTSLANSIMLAQRKVRVGDVEYMLNDGGPQGGIITPLYYTCGAEMRHSLVRPNCVIYGIKIGSSDYCDDNVTFSNSLENRDECVARMQCYAKTFGSSLNASKTQHIAILGDNVPLMIDGIKVEPSEYISQLGVQITSDGVKTKNGSLLSIWMQNAIVNQIGIPPSVLISFFRAKVWAKAGYASSVILIDLKPVMKEFFLIIRKILRIDGASITNCELIQAIGICNNPCYWFLEDLTSSLYKMMSANAANPVLATICHRAHEENLPYFAQLGQIFNSLELSLEQIVSASSAESAKSLVKQKYIEFAKRDLALECWRQGLLIPTKLASNCSPFMKLPHGNVIVHFLTKSMGVKWQQPDPCVFCSVARGDCGDHYILCEKLSSYRPRNLQYARGVSFMIATADDNQRTDIIQWLKAILSIIRKIKNEKIECIEKGDRNEYFMRPAHNDLFLIPRQLIRAPFPKVSTLSFQDEKRADSKNDSHDRLLQAGKKRKEIVKDPSEQETNAPYEPPSKLPRKAKVDNERRGLKGELSDEIQNSSRFSFDPTSKVWQPEDKAVQSVQSDPQQENHQTKAISYKRGRGAAWTYNQERSLQMAVSKHGCENVKLLKLYLNEKGYNFTEKRISSKVKKLKKDGRLCLIQEIIDDGLKPAKTVFIPKKKR